MANEYPDCVGEVDVICDAENIKKLLKVPFSNSHLSLMVHRIGKTLLLDDFDLSKFLLSEEKRQWTWLKRFLEEMNKVDEKIILRKNKSRSNLQSKNMFSKFLHYSMGSIENDIEDVDTSSQETASEELSLSPSKRNREDSWTLDLSSDSFAQELDVSVDDFNSKPHESSSNREHNSYLRNLFWSFENIKMLLGSDMPIFGDSNHPAVSLRLRDMSKPINVLTGIDYWLDNLMCSVPEVVMCYHLDGIVQKYELLKTEDIPQMKNSQFSPKVVRDIAQNILTFLKSKATKSGHTYWLLKSKEGDVVKLYDLTTLCENYYDEDSTNPYALPVAMLLYRVAKHLIDSGSKKRKRIYDLLFNCLNLIDSKKHKKIAVSVRYLLTELLIPNDADPTLPVVLKDDNVSVDEEEDEVNDFFDDISGSQSNTEDSGDENYSTLKVNELTRPRSCRLKRSKLKTDLEDFLGSDWEKRGFKALKYIIEGLSYLVRDESSSFKSSYTPKEETQNFAKPFEPIPMNYSPLDLSECSVIAKVKTCDKNVGNEVITSKDEPNWRKSQTILLLKKSAQIFCFFSELESGKHNYRKALRYIRLGLLCEDTTKTLKSTFKTDSYDEILSCLLGSCGDCHFLMKKGVESSREDAKIDEDIERKFVEICCSLDPRADQERCWCFREIVDVNECVEDRLTLSAKCYEEGLKAIQRSSEGIATSSHSELKVKLKRKYGNVCNELSCLYMNEATNIYEDANIKDETLYSRLQEVTKKSLSHLEKAIQAFGEIEDTVNLIFVYSNTGKLMRICAHIFCPLNALKQRMEFSPKEKHFYAKAISYYELAMKHLTSVSTSSDLRFCYEDIWDQLNWDLCTTWFTMGSLLQDFAPLSYCAFEDIEADISFALKRALRLCCDAEENNSRRLFLYQYRAATINQKLASLYHHSFRNMSDDDSKRRKVFKMADDFFEEAMTGFEKLENKSELLRTVLERVGMHEHLLTSFSGFGSKLKALQGILQILVKAETVLRITETEDEESEETSRLVKLVHQRIQLCVKGLLKLYSSKLPKYKENVKRWKTIEQQLSSSVLDSIIKKKNSKNSLEVYICDVCEKCSKTLELELQCKHTKQ